MRNIRRSDKVRKLYSDRYDVLSLPTYVFQKGPFHGKRHGNTERQRIYHQAHVSFIKQRRRYSNQERMDSWVALFINSHNWTSAVDWKSISTVGWDWRRVSLLHRYGGRTSTTRNNWVLVHDSSLQDVNQFKEKMKLSSGSLIRKKLRD